ncbi:hypothetical protein AB0C34_30910 [Nocardia sp. NPDC049220]|uniref:hypothetical protein n=1 Tax=Nocardia sp. NPDC049220 TaxID=3155273 RepID=UPI0033C40E37
MTKTTKTSAADINPIIAKAAAGVRKRRRTPAGPLPAKFYAPIPGQMSLFDTPTEEDQP